MEPRTITAIEVGSSKIKGAVASVDSAGRMTVLAVASARADNAVRHGRVQNVREVSAAVNDIIRRLENSPGVAPRHIQSVTFSLGGRSLGGTRSTANLHFPQEIEISEQTIQRLCAEAKKDFPGSSNIEAVIPRSYTVNNVPVSKKVVGTVGSDLHGDFLMVTVARENRQNLERLKLESVPSANIDYKLRALAIADAVLTDDDRQLGCALVDFGAESTTVSIYKTGSLAFLATLPMGSRLITMDLMAGLTLTEAAAEEFKVTLGDIDGRSGEGTNGNAEEVNNYVRARAGEIAANIINQINLSGVPMTSLGAGIVLVGGGSRLPGFDTMLASQTRLTVSKGSLPAGIRFADAAQATADNIDIAALLLASDNPVEGLTAAAPSMPEEFNPVIIGEAEVQAGADAASRPEPAVIRFDREEEEEEEGPAAPSPTPRPRRPEPRRQADTYDDLLEDDPEADINAHMQPSKPTRRPKAEPKPAPEYEPEPTEAAEKVPSQGKLQSIVRSIAKIFSPYPEEPEEEEDE